MEDLTNPKNSEFLEELKKASQEIEGTEEIQPPVTEIPKETPIEEGPAPKEREGGGWVSSEKISQDLENHLSEIVKKRKRLEEDRKKIQERLSKVLNLENRIRRFLGERKKIDEELGTWTQN